ncbi:MAG: hypothetical protein ACK5OX_03895 [Desertimonas sp.]
MTAVIDKEHVRAVLRARIEADLAASAEWESDERAASELDPDDSHSVGGQSQAVEAADMASAARALGVGDQAALDALDALDLSATATVRPGAVVSFGGGHYLVGIAARSFDVDGVTFEGIAPDSPVFTAIGGLAAGAAFSANGVDHRLDTVA